MAPDRYVDLEIATDGGDEFTGRITVGEAERDVGRCYTANGDRNVYYRGTIELTVVSSSLPVIVGLTIPGFIEDGADCSSGGGARISGRTTRSLVKP